MSCFPWFRSVGRKIAPPSPPSLPSPHRSGRVRVGRPGRARARLQLEALEDRTLLSVHVINSFKGLDTHDAGGFIEPPDPITAAGPTAVVEIVNSNIAYYDKTTGARPFSTDLGTFFAPVDHVDSLFSDVYVAYDEQAGRFWVSTMDIDFFNIVSYFDFAISNDSNPMHGFTEMHQINDTEVSPRTGEPMFTDFPRLGWNADAYVVTFNMFGFQTQYQYNVQMLTVQKSTVLDQNNATLTYYQVDRPLPNSTLCPASMHGSSPGGPMWFVEEKGLEQNGSYLYLRVDKVTNLLSATPTFTDYYVAVAPYTITPFPGDTLGQISTVLDTRILNVDWLNNQMVASQNVGISSDMNVHARWYEMSTAGTAPKLVQQGTLSPGVGIDTYMPSVALRSDGSIGMTYIESSAVENMSMYVTGRAATDPAGTMETGMLVKAGELNYQGTRIGDFSGVAVDPVTGTFWAVNEYAITTTDLSLPNWGTWLAEFQVGSAAATTFTWTGSGATTNWSDPSNWVGGVTPSAGGNLVFGSSATKFTSTNDFSAGTRFGNITITGGGYAISGNNIVLAGNLDASGATGTNSFGLNLTLPAAETFKVGGTSTTLTLSGTIDNGGFLLTVGGGSGLLDMTNTLSGAGGLTTGSATLVLTGANSYGGGTVLTSGTLSVGNNSALGTGTLTLNGGTFTAAGGAVSLTNAVTLAGNVTIGGSNSLTLTGAVTLTGNRSLTITSTGGVTVSAVIGQSGGTWALTKAGIGSLSLSGKNTYGGGTILSMGSLAVANANAVGAGTLTLKGGTLSATGGAISLANAVTLAGSATISGTNNLTFTGAVTLTGNRALTVSSTGGMTISGAIGQSGGTWALTKDGTGLLVLSGNNTYAGGTTISKGTLLIDGTQASGTVTVKSGGTLGGLGTFGALSVLSGGIVLPGTSTSSTGILNSGNVTFASGSSFHVALNGTTAGSGYDQLNVTGTVSLGGSTLNVSLGFTPAIKAAFTIIHNNTANAVVGTFKNLAEGATFVVNGMTFQITYKGGTGDDVVITRTA